MQCIDLASATMLLLDSLSIMLQVLELNTDRMNGKKGGQGALRKLMEAACAERDRAATKQAQLQVFTA